MFRRDWKIDRLSTIDVLAHLPGRTLRQVRPLTTLLHIPAGTVLFEQGERAQEAFMLLDGEVEFAWNGTPYEIVSPGAVVGGVGLAEAAPRPATATTLTKIETLVMSRAEYRQLLNVCPDVAGRMQAVTRARLTTLRTVIAAG